MAELTGERGLILGEAGTCAGDRHLENTGSFPQVFAGFAVEVLLTMLE